MTKVVGVKRGQPWS